ncbi:hypothetical protein Q4560_15710, partial [Celeribacter halophilus]|nr:hypothetical protein [Celeribacter halophilus]
LARAGTSAMELEKPIPPRGGIIIQLKTVHSVKTIERVDLPAAYAECLPHDKSLDTKFDNSPQFHS